MSINDRLRPNAAGYLAAILSVCLIVLWVPARAAPLRIGWQSADVNVLLTYGLQTKAFEKAGIEVESRPFPSGPAILPAIAAGEIDLGIMGEFPAITGYMNGLPLTFVLVLETYPTNVRLLANPSSGIRQLSDLKGKRLGATFGSVSHYHALLALERAGLSQTDATLVNMGQASMPAAYVAGQIDAVVAWEPAAGEIEKAGAVRLATTDSLGTLVSYNAVSTGPFVQHNPTVIREFLRVWSELRGDLEKDRARVIGYEARRTGKTVQEVDELLGRQGATMPDFGQMLSPDYLGPPNDVGASRFVRHFAAVGAFLLKLDRVKQVPSDWTPLVSIEPIVAVHQSGLR